MYNQISRKRRAEPAIELGEGRFRIYPVDVAGVNSETLKYENWVEYSVFERRSDEFGHEYWENCEVPAWGELAIEKLIGSK
ncbi:MAG TPA: hypothetical protein VMI31_14910 [Fimbriimonadaceae bacterium]|nr:hypothetical protein [Fimbriimonadaceae bacterium]